MICSFLLSSVTIIKINITSKNPDRTSISKDETNASIIDHKFIFDRKRVAIEEGMDGFRNTGDFRSDIRNVLIPGVSSI